MRNGEVIVISIEKDLPRLRISPSGSDADKSSTGPWCAPSRMKQLTDPASLIAGQTAVRSRKPPWFLYLAMTLWCGSLSAQQKYLRFEGYGPDDGLSQATVNAVVRDHTGYLWVGTQDGLNQFDGYQFRIHRDGDALGSTFINELLVDRAGRLWIATLEGLVRHDPDRIGFVPQPLPEMDGHRILALHEDQHGHIWAGTKWGLIEYTDAREEPRGHPFPPNSEIGVPLCMLSAGDVLFFGTRQGLFRFDGETSRVPLPIEDSIQSLASDSNGSLWVLGSSHLSRRDRTGVWQVHEAEVLTVDLPANFSAMLVDRDDDVWLTNRDTLIRFEPETGHTSAYTEGLQSSGTVERHRLRTLYEDRQGLIWIGSYSGLYRFQKPPAGLAHFRHSRDDPGSPRFVSATALTSDRAGNLWVGHNLGVDYLPIDATRFRSLALPEEARFVLSLFVAREGRLWIGTRENGAIVVDGKGNRVTGFRADPGDPDSLPDNGVTTITEDRRGTIWLGTLSGLARYRGKDGGFDTWIGGPLGKGLRDSLISSLAADPRGGLWIGTFRGLHFFAEDGGVIEPIGAPDATQVMDITLSEDRVLVATSEGIHFLARDGTPRQSLNREDGLAGDICYAVEVDNANRIWVSHNGGMSRIGPAAEEIVRFDVHHGLQSNEFNSGAGLTLPDGRLVFGGIGGINLFTPEALQPGSAPASPVLTSLSVDYETVESEPDNPEALLRQPIDRVERLALDWVQRNISFSFSALNFVAPREVHYRFRLKGLNDTWSASAPDQRLAMYTNLAAGRYTFEVQATNHDGMWSEPTSVVIDIASSPFRSPAAIVLYVLIAASFVLAYVYNEKRIQRRLREHVARATEELHQKNRDLDNRFRELETLERIVVSVNQEIDFLNVINTLLEKALELFPAAELGVFFLRDEHIDRFRIVACIGYSIEDIGHISLTESEIVQRYSETEEIERGVYLAMDFKVKVDGNSLDDIPLSESLILMTLPLQGRIAGILLLENMTDPRAFQQSDMARLNRFRAHAISAVAKARMIQDLTETQRELVRSAHLAGMAEIAGNVLHNVGNTVNSIETSTFLMRQALRDNRWRVGLERLIQLVREHREDLVRFLSEHPIGAKLPESLELICNHIDRNRDALDVESKRLLENVNDIRSVLSEQQRLTREDRLVEQVDVNGAIHEALRRESYQMISAAIRVEERLGEVPLLALERDKLQRVLSCLLRNAGEAVRDGGTITITTRVEDGHVTIEIADSGAGIAHESLGKIFINGYTTKADANGFGLHYCANAVREMEGSIEVTSAGPGMGARALVRFPAPTEPLRN